MKSIYSWFIILFVVLVNYTGYAQNSIKGVVSDMDTGDVLPSANVYLPELNKGTLTNEKGAFFLSGISKGKVKIQFSYVGYKTHMITIIPDKQETTLNVSLEPVLLQAEEVVVSGGRYSTQHENAIKIESLGSKRIATSGSQGLVEALTSIPGVDMIAKGTGVTKPVIRGLSMTNILMLNNGVKLENFQFSENHPFIVDEFGTEHAEVIKGPASLLYGSDAVGGVINIIREKPAPEKKIQGDYNMQYHSNTEGVVSNIGIKGSSENFFWGIRGGVKSHTDYKDGNGDYVPNSRFNESVLKLNMGASRPFGLFRLYYDYNRPKLGMCVGDVISLIDGKGRKNKYWYQDLTNHIISAKNTLFPGAYKIDLNVSYQMNNRKLQTDESKVAFEMVDMDLNTLSYEIKAYLPSAVGSEYIIGLQGANETNRNHEAPNHVLPNADVNDFSIFGLAQYSFWKKLQTQAGIRYDYRSINTDAETGRDAVDKDFDDFSASLGATYKLRETILLRANLASAFRTPNIAELTENGMHGTRYEVGNADLKSQRNYEADLSAHFHSDVVMADISGFYNRIQDYIYISPTGETSSGGYDIYQYSQNNAKLYGGEAGISLLPVGWIEASANYSYLIGKQDNDSYLPFIPANKFRIELKLKKKRIDFLNNPYFKIGGLYACKQSNPSDFETETDDYFILNAGAGAEIKWDNQFIFLSVQANNLLNEMYIDHLSTLKSMGYHNIGRNISINMKVPFSVK